MFPKRAELTFESSGDVGEILVEEGDRVREGQVLARLDEVLRKGECQTCKG